MPKGQTALLREKYGRDDRLEFLLPSDFENVPFDHVTAERIIRLIVGGGTLSRAMRAINADRAPDARELTRDLVVGWALRIPEFGRRYLWAQRLSYLHLADEIIDLADDISGDFILNPLTQRIEFCRENISRTRTRIDSRKWLLAKLFPAIYGDKVQATPEGGPEGVATAKDITPEMSVDDAAEAYRRTISGDDGLVEDPRFTPRVSHR